MTNLLMIKVSRETNLNFDTVFDEKKIARAAMGFYTAIIILSCAKEKSCENCGSDTNKPPIAIAKPDTIIILPADSIQLNGSSSFDPDGSITNWSWKKISGPSSFNITNSTTNKTLVKNLVAGVYQFVLKVTDNGGLSAADIVRITVDAVATTNHPPIANAGPDQIITLPLDSVFLDGSASYDPDNNITSYHWAKLSGSTAVFSAQNSVQTKVNGLIPGVYLFELRLTDAFGLTSTDVMQVTVNGH